MLLSDIRQEILAQTQPPLAIELIVRVHYMTHASTSVIQDVLWKLIAEGALGLDDELRIVRSDRIPV